MTKLKLVDSYDPWTETLVEAKPPEFSESLLHCALLNSTLLTSAMSICGASG